MSHPMLNDEIYVDRRDGTIVKVRFWINRGFENHEMARVWEVGRCFSYEMDAEDLIGPLNPLELIAHSANLSR